jgi:membrane fusion protein (multidrug efflux system)
VAYSLQYSGDVQANRQAVVAARINGILETVSVNLGAWVETGQLLAAIDSTEVFQEAQKAAADFYTASADFDRAKQLREKELISQQAFDNAQAQFSVAEAGYRLAKAKLGYARVSAPFSGFITKRFMDPGSQVANGTPLFTLMEMGQVKVAVDVLEKDVPLVTIGRRAAVTVDALPDTSFRGSVVRLSQALDPATRTMRAEVAVSNPGHQLKPGMYATVSILLEERPDAITLPAQAVQADTAGQYVFVVRDGRAFRTAVVPGRAQGMRQEIESGLGGSESVIVVGQQYVRDGGPVAVQP